MTVKEDEMNKGIVNKGRVEEFYNNFCIQSTIAAERYMPVLSAVAVVALVILASSDSAIAQGQTNHPRYGQACNLLLGLMEGSFGALVTVAAGVGAIIASSVGGFKMAWTLVVVAVGAFILRAYITLFFAGCGGL